MPTVAVLGGGVAGLSAAHELVTRGFDVDVYEGHGWVGGKAASQWIRGTGTNGRRDLPGEHGFRFYPSFYTHLIDTMARIPTPGGGSVKDRLIASDEAGVAPNDGETIHSFPRTPIRRPSDFISSMQAAFSSIDADETDIARFTWRILQYLSSSPERRLAEYETISWWDFLDGPDFSPAFQGYLRAVPRTMVAMQPDLGSARTIGDISMQLMLDFGDRANQNDRTLDGPTSERWIEPWEQWLQGQGVRIHMWKRAMALEMTGNRISGVTLSDGTRVEADHYIAAMPIQSLQRVISEEMAAADAKLAQAREIDLNWMTSWMTGAQFFLRDDVPVVRGHAFFPDSDWALTSISQAQFWERGRGRPFNQMYGNGEVRGILSVDISDWYTKSARTGLAAKDTVGREAILDEIWAQMKDGLNANGNAVLRDENVFHRHLDAAIRFPANTNLPDNHARLLVHPPGSWERRPDAGTEIENLYLASDYVRTDTDLASMEGANEAARRAVNELLDRSGSGSSKCLLWPLTEPAVFNPAKNLDRELFERGLPHSMVALEGLADLSDALPGVLRRRLRPDLGLKGVQSALDRLLSLGGD